MRDPNAKMIHSQLLLGTLLSMMFFVSIQIARCAIFNKQLNIKDTITIAISIGGACYVTGFLIRHPRVLKKVFRPTKKVPNKIFIGFLLITLFSKIGITVATAKVDLLTDQRCIKKNLPYEGKKGESNSAGKFKTEFVNIVDEAIQKGAKQNDSGLSLSKKDKQYLLNVARAVLENHFSVNPKRMNKDDFKDVPPNITSQLEHLFVTLLSNRRIRGCQSAKEGNLLENTIEATYRAMSDERFGGVLRREEILNTRLDLTFLLKPVKVTGHKLNQIKKQIELGIHALRLKKGKKSAFFKSSVPVSHGYDIKTTLKKLGKKAGIGENGYRNEETEINRYDTVQFCERFSDKSLVELYRSNLLVNQSYLDRQTHLNALKTARIT